MNVSIHVHVLTVYYLKLLYEYKHSVRNTNFVLHVHVIVCSKLHKEIAQNCNKAVMWNTYGMYGRTEESILVSNI